MKIRNRLILSTIRSKIIFLAFLGIAGMLLISIINIGFSRQFKTHMKSNSKLQEIADNILHSMMLEKTFISSGNMDLLSDYKKIQKDIRNRIDELHLLADNDTLRERYNNLIHLEKIHEKIFQSVKTNIIHINNKKRDYNLKLHQILDFSENIIFAINDEEVRLMMTKGNMLDPMKAELRQTINDFRTFYNEMVINIHELFIFSDIEKYEQTKTDMLSHLSVVKSNITSLLTAINSDELNKTWNQIEGTLPEADQFEKEVVIGWKENRELMVNLEENGKIIQNTAVENLKLNRTRIANRSQKANNISLMLTLIGLAVLFVLSFSLYKAIINPVNRVLKGLNESSENVLSASIHVSSSSQSLAQGTSEQAASSEEISTVTEEISSMTLQNAKNAKQTESSVNTLKHKIENANSSVLELSNSVNEISEIGKDISGIIRIVEDIAFQTNLLALNASIEAARAGNAGLGFSVVADEVRTLAVRSSESAKNISNRIENIILKVEQSSNFVSNTNKIFAEIVETFDHIAVMIGEISVASDEQAKGIGQLAKSFAETDNVIQQNAANAEETASTSEELEIQVEKINKFINELAVMVGKKRIKISERRSADSSSNQIKDKYYDSKPKKK